MEVFGLKLNLEEVPQGATHVVKFNNGFPKLNFRRIVDGRVQHFDGGKWIGLQRYDAWLEDYRPQILDITDLMIWKNAPADATHYTKQAGGRFLKVVGEAVFYSINTGDGVLEWRQYNPEYQMDIARQRLENAQQRLENAQQRPIEEKVMFKKGDKVKVICDHPIGGWGFYVKKGDVGIISNPNPGYKDAILVDFPNHKEWWARPHELELVVPEPVIVPNKKVYNVADLKGTGLDAQLKACAVDARTLRKLRTRVVYNLNNMERFWEADDEKDRLDNINSTFRWRESPEGSGLWLRVHNKQPIKFEDIPAKPRAKKAQVEQAPAIPAQPHVIVPAMVRPDPVVVKAAEAPKKKAEAPAKKVGWW